jgi:thioredoxin-dependent peroxiredoxin
MFLQNEVKAPHFKVKDVYGRVIDLNDFADKKLLIGFFRHAGCPFCNLRVHALSKAHADLKKEGLEMIFFFESKENVILRSSFHQGVSPIPIISDPGKVYYEKYGIETSAYKSGVSHIMTFAQTAFKARSHGLPIHMMASGESISTMPAEFLLDSELVVKKVHYSQRLNDRLDIADIKQFAVKGTLAEAV